MSSKIETRFYKIANLLLMAVVAVGAVHALWGWWVERSLWIDEAMLMKSVVTRDFAGILSGFFEDNQSAPLGYMLGIKLITAIFGSSSPTILRIFSILLYFGSGVLVYLIARKGMKFRLPMLPVAVIMGLATMQYYASEAKPYMGDVFFSLLSIWIYYCYRRQTMSMWVVSVIMAASVWFAFSALFTMGGICIWHFMYNTRLKYLKAETWKKYISETLPLVIVGVSALLYYFLWALPASTNVPDESLDNYWSQLSFPFIPKGMSDIKLMIMMWFNFIDIGEIGYVASRYLMLGLVIYFIVSYKSWLTWASVISAFLIMLVSSMGMYPIEHRLLLGQYVILWLLAIYAGDKVVKNIAKNVFTLILAILLVFVPLGFAVSEAFNFSKDSFYRPRQEFKMCYEYVKSVKTDDAMIYITPSGRPAAQYYMGYPDMSSMYETEISEWHDVIFGGMFRQVQSHSPYSYTVTIQDDRVADNVKAIMKYKDVYILDIHAPWVHKSLLEALDSAGCRVEKDTVFYNTSVWHCTH